MWQVIDIHNFSLLTKQEEDDQKKQIVSTSGDDTSDPSFYLQDQARRTQQTIWNLIYTNYCRTAITPRTQERLYHTTAAAIRIQVAQSTHSSRYTHTAVALSVITATQDRKLTERLLRERQAVRHGDATQHLYLPTSMITDQYRQIPMQPFAEVPRTTLHQPLDLQSHSLKTAPGQ